MRSIGWWKVSTGLTLSAWSGCVHAQAAPAPPSASAATGQKATGGDILVTGIRGTLERAADIKRRAAQVVDSIVAQDIGKLPDPTTAAALQRVPGVQVSVNRNNELSSVLIRGLPDVLTTVDGREIFTATSRTLDLTDLPAEALSRVDVYKSQSPDLLEGGLAGIIDLQLNKPFNFKKPTVVLSARGNYGLRAGKGDPQLGALATRRWDTPIGEIGLLLNGTWSRSDYERDETILSGLRGSAATPLNTPGYLVPNIMQNFPEQGRITRTQFNGALQWQASPTLEVYLDGLYTRSRDRGAHYGANIQPYTTGVTMTNPVSSGQCFQTRATSAGQNPTISADASGNQTLGANTVQNLCYLKSAQFNNIVVNQTTQARDDIDQNKLVAGGFKFDHDGWKAHVDASYQSTSSRDELIVVDVGQRLPSVTLDTGDDGVAHFTIPGNGLLSTDNLYIRNSFQQTFSLTKGSIFAVRADGSKEIGGFLQQVKFGARYASRTANSYAVVLNTATPGGNIGTATESTAVKVSATGLPSGFLSVGAKAPDINGGQAFYAPDPDFLLSPTGQDALRQYFGLATGTPAYQKSREFDAYEHTISAYGEADYLVPLGGVVSLDGVVGGRFVQTVRGITSFVAQGTGYAPINATTTDRDFLPTATARFKFGEGLQARLSYNRTIRRPDFSDLHPAVTLSLSNNPFVQSSGTAGNSSLKEQKSDNLDATLEYYFHGGYVSLGGFYRHIKDRVITGAANETIGGVDYSITRPRNIGSARIDGVEVSGQYFLDFLPAALSGLGVQGAFTLADSKIGGGDTLAGYPLAGVSKYSFTSGLLYEKYGISGRLVYTYRSRYITSDQTGSISLRPIDSSQVGQVTVPTLLSYVRPAGRLDFSIGYDITKAIRVDVGGTNILRSMTKDYLGQSFETFEAFYDETTYTVGVRIKI